MRQGDWHHQASDADAHERDLSEMQTPHARPATSQAEHADPETTVLACPGDVPRVRARPPRVGMVGLSTEVAVASNNVRLRWEATS